MQKLLYFLFSLTILIGCQEEKPETTKLEISQPAIRLGGDARSEARFTIKTNYSWHIMTSGDGFELSALSGKKGSTDITVWTTQMNNRTSRKELGTITIETSNGKSQQTLKVEQSPQKSTHTSIVYMTGRSLLGYYEKNLKALKSAVTAQMPGDGRIMVCYQPKSATSAELYEIYYDAATQKCEQKLIKNYDTFLASDPNAITQLIDDVVFEAPALTYGMTIGCHGKGWIPSGKSLKAYSTKHERDLWVTAPGAMQTRAYGDTGYELNIKDLASAIEQSKQKLEYLIFDACFMANIETIYDLRKVTKNIIGSPCEVMAAGYPYDRTLPYLFTDGGAKYDLERVCEEFWMFYMYDWQTIGTLQSGCISLAQTEHIEALTDLMKRINAKFEKPNPANIQIYEALSSHLFYDLGNWVTNGCKDAALLSEFEQTMELAFPRNCRLYTPAFYSAYNDSENMIPINYYSGVTLSEPSAKYQTENQQTGWYMATH